MKSYRDSYYIISRLKQARKACCYSQSELAALCCTTQNTISNIENGVYLPSIFLALLLCDALMCNIDDIFVIRPKSLPIGIDENIFS